MVSTVIAPCCSRAALFAGSTAKTARAEGEEAPPSQEKKWSFAGPFGNYDRGALQRGAEGLQGSLLRLPWPVVYIAFRNLADPGGPGYSPAQAAAFAAEYKIKDGPETIRERCFERPGRPADYFPLAVPQRGRAGPGSQWRRTASRTCR